MDTNTLLARANTLLSRLFPQHRPITLAEVEAVYSRTVLTTANAKTAKGDKRGYLTGILYLSPARMSGLEVCAGRSAGCTAACLFTAGRGRFYSVTRARLVKTLALHLDTPRFIKAVARSIERIERQAARKNMIPVVRLNGTSDLPVEAWGLFERFPGVQFYDYTKILARALAPRASNYHLTFSLSENNKAEAYRALEAGVNVAAVFYTLPAEFMERPVVSGDETDLRFLDAPGVVVGLTAKGRAKKDVSGFVQSTEKREVA